MAGAAHHRAAQMKGKQMNELTEAAVELSRELTVRNNVYPKLVASGKLTQHEADRRMRAMRYGLYLIERAMWPTDSQQPTTRE